MFYYNTMKRNENQVRNLFSIMLLGVIFLTNFSFQKQFQTQQERINFQHIQQRYIQSENDIEKVRLFLNQLEDISEKSQNDKENRLIQIHLELAKLYEKLKLFQDSQAHVNLAYQINPQNIQTLWQKTKKLIKNHNHHQNNQTNENLKQIEINLNFLQKNIDRLSFQAKLQFVQIKSLIHQKSMVLKKGYQFAPSWIEAIKNNHLKLQYFLDKSEFRQINDYTGVFAKQEIPQQKIIFVQRPFFYLSQSEGLNNDNQNNKQLIINKYKNLSSISKNFRQKFANLSNEINKQKINQQIQNFVLTDEQIFEKYKKNAFLIYQLFDIIKGNPPHYRVGLYEFPSLINYSCDPNLQYFFIGDFILIRTLKKIEKDEELTFTYMKPTQKLQTQENYLMWQHRNDACTCTLCKNIQKQDEKKINKFLNGEIQLAKQFIKESKLHLIPIFEELNEKALKMQILASALDFGGPKELSDGLDQNVDWKIKRQQL